MFGRGRNYQRFEDDNVGNQRTTQTEKENGHDEEQGSRPSEANATESKPDGTAAKTTNVNSIKVKVLDTQGRTYTVPVPAGGATTVADLKSALAAEGGAGVATELQRLIYAGRILEDSQTLQSCGITGEQTVVHLFARRPLAPAAAAAAAAAAGAGAAGADGGVPTARVVPAGGGAGRGLPGGAALGQVDFNLLQSSRRVRFLSAFLFLVSAMQVMACMAIMASSYGSDSTNGNNDNNNDGDASKDSAQSSAGLEDGGDSLQFGFVDYVLLVINMLGMAMGLLGMRGSQNFELDTVKTYVKGLITTGVVSMMLKVYWLLRVASEISDGTYPGLGDSDDSAAGHTGPSGGAAGGDSSPADSSATSSSSLSSDKQLTGSDVMSDALFSTAVAAAIWFYCFYRAVQFRNQLQAASGPRREATRELHATAAAAAV